LPNRYHFETERAQGIGLAFVSFTVGRYLIEPERRIALGHRSLSAAIVSVPETAMDEDGPLSFSIHDIGRAGERTVVTSITHSEHPQQLS